MTSKARRRLPDVKTLSEILPKGAEGGKEFARIVDLLLFREARRSGKRTVIFSDAAGDYGGLDSLEDGGFRKEGTVGYQYKFFPSPLSSQHRRSIVESLRTSAGGQRKLKLKRWILVTPNDLVESGSRKGGGDVTWFENLKSELNLKFQVEHWGHKKLLALFLETPSICLFYYPELISDGVSRRKTIQEVRSRYDEAFVQLQREIQFVGMSVYKPEATKGVPMEHIYIPLSLLPEGGDPDGTSAEPMNPLEVCLAPGAKSVVLGDPGSGKSTLLKFLALAGLTKALQERYSANADTRLPIHVTLRRYGDELKNRPNLSILDYMKESVRADLSLPDVDSAFLEYYMESGQAILLFDGVDELSGGQAKQIVRDRILTLLTTHPGNTVVVTSRIVGYEQPFRSTAQEFAHFVVAKLRLPQIERFVEDWYRFRIENKAERDANVGDLKRILGDEGNEAIRQLAENPLLLTIVVLVHRIDAVLPDERVILYQKCTETLLNTWHTWKFRASEVKHRGKIERRNRRRMEAIAYWMQSRSRSARKTERAIVPFEELHEFLTQHIDKYEQSGPSDEESQDQATEFLDFIKRKAGLLIEVGAQQYSFVHLTFQEYLASSDIITYGERNGAGGIWTRIRTRCSRAGWHEVIRLLVAGLRSDDSQQFIVDKLLSLPSSAGREQRARLAGGLLLDGVAAAQQREEEILSTLATLASQTKDPDDLSTNLNVIRSWLRSEPANAETLSRAVSGWITSASSISARISLTLVGSSLGVEGLQFPKRSKASSDHERLGEFYDLLLGEDSGPVACERLEGDIKRFFERRTSGSIESQRANFVAAAGLAVAARLGLETLVQRAFDNQLVVFGVIGPGPFTDLFRHCLLIYGDPESAIPRFGPSGRMTESSEKYRTALAMVRTSSPGIERLRVRRERVGRERVGREFVKPQKWQQLVRDVGSSHAVAEVFWEIVGPELHQHQWIEAIRVRFVPTVPNLVQLFEREKWEELESAFDSGAPSLGQTGFAAWLLLFDSWLYLVGSHESSDSSPLSRIAKKTEGIEDPRLQVARCLRDIAYGDQSRLGELEAMLRSSEPAYQALFRAALWEGPPKTRANAAKKATRVKKRSRSRASQK